MQGVVKKWGNSAAVRIPAAVLAAASLGLDQAVDVREEGGRIIIEPVVPTRYELDDLLAGMTPDNLHAEIDTGVPRGREIW